ncbi:hypothetical protein GO730_01350 [Spirosoma sp. HMF3257]|uniref:hypothetical protein n=1 Tax=Spirosoma telluris TaxID=2183553 RepID=UPI0012F770C2|nr:hypothetical protein [Spirosoma telluris]
MTKVSKRGAATLSKSDEIVMGILACCDQASAHKPNSLGDRSLTVFERSMTWVNEKP